MRNLVIAIELLSGVNGGVGSDIRGILEDKGHWDQRCEIMIWLSASAEVTYKAIALAE